MYFASQGNWCTAGSSNYFNLENEGTDNIELDDAVAYTSSGCAVLVHRLSNARTSPPFHGNMTNSCVGLFAETDYQIDGMDPNSWVQVRYAIAGPVTYPSAQETTTAIKIN